MTHSAENLIWPLIEAENLRGGLACKAAIEKNRPERSGGRAIIFGHEAWPCEPKRYKFASAKAK